MLSAEFMALREFRVANMKIIRLMDSQLGKIWTHKTVQHSKRIKYSTFNCFVLHKKVLLFYIFTGEN